MAEYALIPDTDGTEVQYCDTTLCIIIDTVTAEPQRFGETMNATGTLKEALAFVSARPSETLAIVPLRVIRPHKLTKE